MCTINEKREINVGLERTTACSRLFDWVHREAWMSTLIRIVALFFSPWIVEMSEMEDQEVIELVPNIILNPGFEGNTQLMPAADENSNNETTTRLNNNTVVYQRNQ